MMKKVYRGSDLILDLDGFCGNSVRVADLGIEKFIFYTLDEKNYIECSVESGSIIIGEEKDKVILNASELKSLEEGVLNYAYFVKVEDQGEFNDRIYNETIVGQTDIFLKNSPNFYDIIHIPLNLNPITDSVTTTRKIDINLNANDVFTHYRINESGSFIEDSWKPATGSTISYTLSSTNGSKVIYVQIKNSVEESPIKRMCTMLKLPIVDPFNLSIKINNEEETTSNTTVKVFLGGKGVRTAYMIGEKKDLSDATWVNTSLNVIQYTFKDTSKGTKTLYAKVKNTEAESQIAFSTIELI